MSIIAIIDTGANISHPCLLNKKITSFSLENKNGTYCFRECFDDKIGHGTAITSIIASELSEEDCIIVFRIFDDEFEIEQERLAYTLKYIDANIHVDIINMSIGLTQCSAYSELKNICDKLCSKGVVLISAYDNNGAVSYPAAFSSVIGVGHHDLCKRNDDYVFVENSCVEILGKGMNQKLCWTGKTDYIIGQGNSFACAHISSFIVKNYLSQNAPPHTIHSVKEFLKKHASRFISLPTSKETPKPFPLGKIAIFPVNKETKSIINYADLLNGELSLIFDIKESGNIGRTTNDIVFRKSGCSLTIKNIESIDVYEEYFDTLVIGHLDIIERITRKNHKINLINWAKKHNKNIFCLDGGVPNNTTHNSSQYVYSPVIDQKHVRYDMMGKLRAISTPILLVCGTSSQQGKFSLQLGLRNQFIKNGYSIGQWSTEPQAQLFGIDEVFPAGYNSKLSFMETEVLNIINYQLAKIEEKSTDIILAGAQSFTIPYNMVTSNMYPEYQNVILSAIQPDATILCINIYDEIDFIKRNIAYVESLTESVVVLIAIYPIGKKSTWSFGTLKNYICDYCEIEAKKQEINSILNLPAFSMDEVDEIFDTIVGYLRDDTE